MNPRNLSLPRGAFLAIALTAATCVHAAQPDVTFAGCTEFVGVAFVPEAPARALVPNQFNLVADASGARLVVRIADCSSVRVGNLSPRPGRVAHVGIMITSPDGTATDPNTSINNYTLSYATNLPALVLRLRAADVQAVLDPDLNYEYAPKQGPSEFYATVTPEFGLSPTWVLHGSITNPTIPTPFLANWWSARGGKVTKMSTDIGTILFDFTSSVSFYTSRNNVIGQLVGSNRIASFPISFRGAFETGDMTVTVRH